MEPREGNITNTVDVQRGLFDWADNSPVIHCQLTMYHKKERVSRKKTIFNASFKYTQTTPGFNKIV